MAYIDAERAKRIIIKTEWENKGIPLAFCQMIDLVPTADVVEVVRCEECEHSREIDRGKSPERYFNSHCIVCECEKVVGDEPMIYPRAHFCSYGKRRDT